MSCSVGFPKMTEIDPAVPPVIHVRYGHIDSDQHDTNETRATSPTTRNTHVGQGQFSGHFAGLLPNFKTDLRIFLELPC